MGRQTSTATVLAEFLSGRGLRATRQRALVVNAFLASGGHVSADDLAARVRSADPRVSLATVYRTMKLLTESGLADARRFGADQVRYEPARPAGRDHHDHLICTRCGAIVEFAEPRIEALQASVARARGFALTHHTMELFGPCPKCLRARRRAGAAP